MDEPPPSKAAPRSGLASALPLVTGLVALVGGAAYAIMRYSYGQYYNVFGLTPDDVGPSSAAALTQSGVGVALFVVLFAVLPVTLALLGALGVEHAVRHRFTTRRPRAVAVLVLPAAAAVGIYLAFSYLTNGHDEWPALVALAVGVVLLTMKQSDGDWTYEAASRLPRTRWIVAALIGVVAALELGHSLPRDAISTARCAIDRNLPVRFVHTHRRLPFIGYLAVLRVRSDRAELSWIDGGTHPALPRAPLVYLGDSGGRYFVYSTPGKRAVQVPDSQVLLRTIAGLPHCHPF